MSKSTDILCLFADTNLFAQCRALEELDWSIFGAYSEVRIIVSRPIQEEIDNQKNSDRKRLAKRAATTARRFRQIIAGNNVSMTLLPGPPHVTLYLLPQIKPDPDIADQLDYSKNDDRLVGIAHQYRRQNLIHDVAVLTHDTGPMLSAKAVGLSYKTIPDEWLLPPESNDADRQISALRTENERLKRVEPQFSIECRVGSGNAATRLELVVRCAKAMSDAHITELLALLKQRHPMATDFGSKERAERPIIAPFRIAGFREQFEPASDDDIEKYRSATYPDWITACEQRLRNWHVALQMAIRAPLLGFAVANTGSRPGTDALVTIATHGNFSIVIPRPPDDAEAENDDVSLSLPSVPPAPRGAWHHVMPGIGRDFRSLMSAFDRASNPSLAAILARPLVPGIPDLRPPRPRDPNQFYFKPERPNGPTSRVAFECQQWRHSGPDEDFIFEISVPDGVSEVSGTLTCIVEAENLSTPARLLVPVRITVEIVSAYESARSAIDAIKTAVSLP